MVSQKKVPDEVIINILKKHKVLSQSELEELLSYGKNSLRPRLYHLVRKNKIKLKILPHRSRACSYVIFKGYTDTSVYYVDDNDLIEWIKNRIPKSLPKSIRKIVTMKLSEIGINLDLSPRTQLKLIAVKPYIHKKLKNAAKRKNESIQNITEEALLSYLG